MWRFLFSFGWLDKWAADLAGHTKQAGEAEYGEGDASLRTYEGGRKGTEKDFAGFA